MRNNIYFRSGRASCVPIEVLLPRYIDEIEQSPSRQGMPRILVPDSDIVVKLAKVNGSTMNPLNQYEVSRPKPHRYHCKEVARSLTTSNEK